MNIDLLVAILTASFVMIAPLVVNLLAALVLLVIGLLIARGLGALTTFIFKLIQLDLGAKQIGLEAVLQKGQIKKTLSELLGSLVYWVVVFVALVVVFGVFGLPIEGALIKIFAYMGVVLLAALILGVGVLLAGAVSSLVRVIMSNLGLAEAKTVARVIYYVVVVFTFIAALAELGVSPEVFIPQLGVIIGAFGLAAAIAFGLGCKDMAADFLHNLFKGK